MNLTELRRSMTLEEKIGQLILVGDMLPTGDHIAGEVEHIIRAIKPAGVRLYGCWGDKQSKREYSNRLQQLAGRNRHRLPLLISADCEGGTPEVLAHGGTSYPYLMGRAASASLRLTEQISAHIAKEAAEIGLNMLHQPDADVNTCDSNPVIGVRSPGTQPNVVSEYATATMQGLVSNNIIPVAKHFPGHGDTVLDSHVNLPVISSSISEFRSVHLKPFVDLIQAGVDCIMTAHIVVEALDSVNPATLSSAVLTDLLRGELGFTGVIITDGMSMKAISSRYAPGQAAVDAIAAGADLLLLSGDPESQLDSQDALLRAVETGDLSHERIDESVDRVLRVKQKHGLLPVGPDSSVAGETKGTSLSVANALAATGSGVTATDNVPDSSFAQSAYESCMQIYGSNPTMIPLQSGQAILVVGLEPAKTFSENLMEDGFAKVHYAECATHQNADTTSRDTAAIKELAKSADVVVIWSYAKDAPSEVVNDLARDCSLETQVLIVSLGYPVETALVNENTVVLTTYIQNSWGRPSPLPNYAQSAVKAVVTQPRH